MIYNTLSIIIPTYQRINDIETILHSIECQTLLPSEIIIVDDTPDESIKLFIERYVKKNREIDIKYCRNKNDRSINISRNLGVDLAKEEIILFLDSDTLLYPDYIENIIYVFNNYNKAIGVQGFIVNLYNNRSKKIQIMNLVNKLLYLSHYTKYSCNLWEYPLLLNKIIKCEWLSGSNMAYKRNIFNKIKFDEKLKKYSYMDDVLFSYSAYKLYNNSLYMTPFARLIHNKSEKGRLSSWELDILKKSYRKYVLYKIYGYKYYFIYPIQELRLFTIRKLMKK